MPSKAVPKKPAAKAPTASVRPAATVPATSAKPFIRIEDGKLRLKGLPVAADAPARLRVVTILGKARMGKSTFLNAVVAHAFQGGGGGTSAAAPTPFSMSSEDEHCTSGMDAYLIPAAQLPGGGSGSGSGRADVLLLDCQGLALDDSSHDPDLLLATYLLSDVVIFNEHVRLSNDTLGLLTPVATFAAKLDVGAAGGGSGDGAKPSLLFRVADCQIKGDVGEAVERVLLPRDDQYDSLRDALRTQFALPIGAIKTGRFDQSHLDALQSSSSGIATLLADPHLGFASAAGLVLSAGSSRYTGRQWCELVPKVLEQVNAGGRVLLERLDVVRQGARADMSEFVVKLPASLTAPLEVDATQATYEANVVPRIAAVAKALADFDKRFHLIGADLRLATRRELERRLAEPIEVAQSAASKLALEAISGPFATARTPTPTPLAMVATNAVASVAQQADALKAALETRLRPLRNAAAPLYEPVADPVLAWADKQEVTLATALASQAASEKSAAKAVADACAVLTSGKLLPEHLKKTFRGAIDPANRAHLLMPPEAVGTRVLRELVRRHHALTLVGTWMSAEMSSTGDVRVVLSQFDGTDSVLAFYTEWDGSREPGARQQLVARPAAVTAAAAAAEAYFSSSGSVRPTAEALTQALVEGRVPSTHGLLGPLAHALANHVVPAVRRAGGPLATELARIVETALADVYEVTDTRGHGFVGMDGHHPVSSGSSLPTFLRRVQQVHPSLELVSVAIMSAPDLYVFNPAYIVDALLMTRTTYSSTWEAAFKLAAANVVKEGYASDADTVLRLVVKTPPRSVDAAHPVARVYTSGTTLPQSASRSFSISWATRGRGEQVPHMFHEELRRVLARDDERAGRDDGGERLFARWRSVDEAFKTGI